MRRTITTLGSALLCALLAAGCGDRATDVPTTALNLTSGAIETFPSPEDVPPGWISCATSDCSEVEDVPCQNLGEKVCALNPSCRLKLLGCHGVGCTTSPEGEPAPGCVPQPPVCDYVCLPKTPLLCDELKDQASCEARADCSWGPGVCPAMPCLPGEDCPPCEDVCQPKAPPACAELDSARCEERSDCVWDPAPCVCPPGEPCPCGAFCREREQPCPAIAPMPPDFCPPPGRIVPRYDENGCATGFDCIEECPAVAPPPPCDDGTLVPKYDGVGCLIGYECDSNSDCDQLASAYRKALEEAKGCNPLSPLPVEQCVLSVSNDLACGCPTYVNPQNHAAVQKLDDLQLKWDALGCQQGVLCPAMPCWAPAGATCEGTAAIGGGACKDQL